MKKTLVALSALLTLPALHSAAAASRLWFEREQASRPARDYSAMRPPIARDTTQLPRTGVLVPRDPVLQRFVERVRPRGEATERPNMAARQGEAHRNTLAREDSTLSRQHSKRGQGVLDAAMAKASGGHATSSTSNGGSSSRDARKTAARLRAIAQGQQGVLERRFMQKMQGLVDGAMAKASKGHATTRESNGGNNSRKARISASKMREAAREGQSVLGRLHLKKVRALLQKQKAKATRSEGR